MAITDSPGELRLARVNKDGTTDYILIDETFCRDIYVPQPPKEGSPFVTEQITLLHGISDQGEEAIRDVMRWLKDAARRLMFPRYYVEFKARPEYTEWWRSRIMPLDFIRETFTQSYRSTGVRSLDTDTFRWHYTFSSNAKTTIKWTRLYFWEGEEVQIEFGDPPTGIAPEVKTIQNMPTGPSDNFVLIQGEQITGELETPVKFRMQVNYDTTTPPSNELAFIFGNMNNSQDPFNMTHGIEGENVLAPPPIGTTHTIFPFGTVSQGQFLQATWTGDQEQLLGVWDVPAAFVDAYCGGEVEVYLGQAPSILSSGYVLRTTFQTLTGSVYSDNGIGTQILNADPGDISGVVSLGVLNLPTNVPDWGSVRLALYARNTFAGPTTMQSIHIDYLYLAGLDGRRELSTKYENKNGVALMTNDVLWDDPIEDFIYVWENGVSTDVRGDFRAFSQMNLVPLKDTKITFLMKNVDGEPRTNHNFVLRAWFRPRKSMPN